MTKRPCQSCNVECVPAELYMTYSPDIWYAPDELEVCEDCLVEHDERRWKWIQMVRANASYGR